MKTKIARQLLATIAAAAIVGCGGGDSGGGRGDSGASGGPPRLPPPFISGLSYSPTAGQANSGGGQVTVHGSILFSNAGDGGASVTIAVLDQGGATVATNTTPIANGSTSATAAAQVNVNTAVAGNYTIRVTLRDLAGRDSNTLTGSFRVATALWFPEPAMPTPRQSFAVAASGTRIYVIGGELAGMGTPGRESALVEVFDTVTETWRASGSPMPTSRKSSAAAAVGDAIYVIGGASLAAPGGLTTVEAFYPAAAVWLPLSPMPTPRSGAAVAVLNDQICVFGGKSGGIEVATTECYNPDWDMWFDPMPSMPTARYSLGAGVIGEAVYAVGGAAAASATGYAGTAERFNVNETWGTVAPMPTLRENAGVAAVGGLLY